MSSFRHALIAETPAAPADDQQPPVSPYGTTPVPFTYPFSQIPATQFAGGTVKIADSTTFKAAKTIAVAEITVEPGALRELHVSHIMFVDFGACLGLLDNVSGTQLRMNGPISCKSLT